MLEWFLSLPRVRWHGRVLAGLLFVLTFHGLWAVHGKIPGISVSSGWWGWLATAWRIWMGSGLLMIVVFGRRPHSWTFSRQGIDRTIPEIYRDSLAAQQKRRETSCKL